MSAFFESIRAHLWEIILLLASGVGSAATLIYRWNRANRLRHARLAAENAALAERQSVFETRLDAALAASTVRHNDETAACDRCRADVLERIMRSDTWAREDSQNQWAATHNLIQKMEDIAKGVARIEGLLDAQRLAERKQTS